ncbi:MAG: hypothetical protein DRN05_00290 [Thermoplasmata archaeon]|nr:MAG: hypothetical protein DRN05_00290 [Thermoplasmata archaeon]
MVYWKEWKSLIGGGIGFLILGIFMIMLITLPGASSGRGAGGLDIMQIIVPSYRNGYANTRNFFKKKT